MGAQHSVSATVRVTDPHRGMAAPAGERALVGDGRGARQAVSLPVDSLDWRFSGYVLLRHFKKKIANGRSFHPPAVVQESRKTRHIAVVMLAAVLGFNTAASGFVLSGALRAPVAQQAIQMVDVGAACTGTCKWFDSSKGFGFIAVDGEESDIFVHQSEIYSPGFRSLADGEKVEFKVSADDRTGEHQSTRPLPVARH